MIYFRSLWPGENCMYLIKHFVGNGSKPPRPRRGAWGRGLKNKDLNCFAGQ
jgi:hypothetical protein